MQDKFQHFLFFTGREVLPVCWWPGETEAEFRCQWISVSKDELPIMTSGFPPFHRRFEENYSFLNRSSTLQLV